jgi:hypothetical protein
MSSSKDEHVTKHEAAYIPTTPRPPTSSRPLPRRTQRQTAQLERSREAVPEHDDTSPVSTTAITVLEPTGISTVNLSHEIVTVIVCEGPSNAVDTPSGPITANTTTITTRSPTANEVIENLAIHDDLKGQELVDTSFDSPIPPSTTTCINLSSQVEASETSLIELPALTPFVAEAELLVVDAGDVMVEDPKTITHSDLEDVEMMDIEVSMVDTGSRLDDPFDITTAIDDMNINDVLVTVEEEMLDIEPEGQDTSSTTAVMTDEMLDIEQEGHDISSTTAVMTDEVMHAENEVMEDTLGVEEPEWLTTLVSLRS